MAEGKVLYVPQEIPLEKSGEILAGIQEAGRAEKGKIMTIISRLGSDPEHLLETALPTPGEVRKLMLAQGIFREPALIIMDEPTNHMDLPSIECVESALKECSCTQLLVSHDHCFLHNVTDIAWKFSAAARKNPKVDKNAPGTVHRYYIDPITAGL